MVRISSIIKNALSKGYMWKLERYFYSPSPNDVQLLSFDIANNSITGTISIRNLEYAEIVAYSKYSKDVSNIPLQLSYNSDTRETYKFTATLPKNPLHHHYEIRKHFNKTGKISILHSLLEEGYSNSGLIFGPSGSGKSYFMNQMVEVLRNTANEFIIIDSDYLDPRCRYFKSVPETVIDTIDLPQFSSKSVLRIGDIAHAENSIELETLLTSILDNPTVNDSSFVFINCGDVVLRKISAVTLEMLLAIISKKKLKLITSFQRIYDTIENRSVKILAEFCDRFYFTCDHLDTKDIALAQLLIGKAPAINGYRHNTIEYYDAPQIFANIQKRKDIYYLGPKTKDFIER